MLCVYCNKDITEQGAVHRCFVVCHVTGKQCEHYTFQRDRNEWMAIEHCSHPNNPENTEGNCKESLCPLLK